LIEIVQCEEVAV